MQFVLTDFCLKHFDGKDRKPAIPGITPEDFEKEINSRLPSLIEDGYAPFCRLYFFKNWTAAQAGIIPITLECLPFIETEYEARQEKELPVLMRYYSCDYFDLKAKYLCIVVYDKEQMLKEGTKIDADYAVVNILRLMDLQEPPLPPITMMRNALGVAEGGSGVPLNREKYMKSVAFWSNHVTVKTGRYRD